LEVRWIRMVWIDLLPIKIFRSSSSMQIARLKYRIPLNVPILIWYLQCFFPFRFDSIWLDLILLVYDRSVERHETIICTFTSGMSQTCINLFDDFIHCLLSGTPVRRKLNIFRSVVFPPLSKVVFGRYPFRIVARYQLFWLRFSFQILVFSRVLIILSQLTLYNPSSWMSIIK
jgi:hypothetical protein